MCGDSLEKNKISVFQTNTQEKGGMGLCYVADAIYVVQHSI